MLLKWSHVTQSCPTLCDPMDCSLQASFVHGIFQARVLEWAAISFFRGSSWPRDRMCTGGQILYHWDIREVLQTWYLYLKDEKEAYFSCGSLNHKEHHNFYEQRNNVPLKGLRWKTELNTHTVHSLHSQTPKGSKQLSRIWGPGAGGAVGSRE